ncbi:MAG: glycine oxidase ThiO [Planctomycetales bacterium]|nr:glycine oxidase ThiO [Planctomycetales bacterium]
MDDCLIIGGGVIGLSLAYELAGHALRVRVVDQQQPARAASWAGAGMLPPGSDAEGADPVQRLSALSVRLYREWSQELFEATGIDNGYKPCGAIYIARDDATRERQASLFNAWCAGDIDVTPVDASLLRELEPSLLPTSGPTPTTSHLVAAESQVRNPRHLKALLAGCRRRGVQIEGGMPVHDFEIRDGRATAALTPTGRIVAGNFCLTAGAWSVPLASRLGIEIDVRPVRGQICLVATERPRLQRIVNEGPRYLVPRGDGLVLVGSTEEDVGFDCRTTVGRVQGLLKFAASLVPELADAELQRSWAGLRPASRDGLPYLGRVARTENCYVAAGHFRHGLRMAPATARVIGQLMRHEACAVELTPFCPERHIRV